MSAHWWNEDTKQRVLEFYGVNKNASWTDLDGKAWLIESGSSALVVKYVGSSIGPGNRASDAKLQAITEIQVRSSFLGLPAAPLVLGHDERGSRKYLKLESPGQMKAVEHFFTAAQYAGKLRQPTFGTEPTLFKDSVRVDVGEFLYGLGAACKQIDIAAAAGEWQHFGNNGESFWRRLTQDFSTKSGYQVVARTLGRQAPVLGRIEMSLPLNFPFLQPHSLVPTDHRSHNIEIDEQGQRVFVDLDELHPHPGPPMDFFTRHIPRDRRGWVFRAASSGLVTSDEAAELLTTGYVETLPDLRTCRDTKITDETENVATQINNLRNEAVGCISGLRTVNPAQILQSTTYAIDSSAYAARQSGLAS